MKRKESEMFVLFHIAELLQINDLWLESGFLETPD